MPSEHASDRAKVSILATVTFSWHSIANFNTFIVDHKSRKCFAENIRLNRSFLQCSNLIVELKSLYWKIMKRTEKHFINISLIAVARSEACPLGIQAVPSSIPTSGTFFRGDLVMKKFLRPFSLYRWFKKSSCQLLAKECALSTGKLPRWLAQEQFALEQCG